MPRILPIQQSFEFGEISDMLYARSDLDAYQKGAKEIVNYLSTIYGPVKRRGGTEHLENVDGVFGRLFDFYVSTFIGFTIVVTPTFVYVADSSGIALVPGFVTNPSFTDGGTGWTVVEIGAGNVIFLVGTCVLDPGTGAGHDAAIQQNVTGLSVSETHRVKINIASGEGPMEVRVGTTQGGGEIHFITYFTSQTIEFDVPSGYTSFWIEARVTGGEITKVLESFEVYEISSIGQVSFPSPWTTQEQIHDIQYDMEPGTNTMWLTCPNVPPQELIYDPVALSWTFQAIGFTSPPAEWTGSNWPRALCFEQGRVWLGGTPEQPENFWGSKSGLFRDFTPPVDEENPVADDAIYFSMNKKGAIHWIRGHRDLIIGTEKAEHLVTSQGGIIRAGDIDVRESSAYGSAPIQALQVGDKIIFVAGDRRKIREMGYLWTKAGYENRDLTINAEHITKNAQIRHIHYAKNPDSILTMTAINGNVINCTYDVSTGALGWHSFITDGRYLSTCVIEYGGTSRIFTLVDRDGEGTQMSLERSDPTIQLDNYGFQFNDPPANTVSIPHLADKTVQVIADGALHPDITLDGSGNGTLQKEYSNIFVGLQYIATLVTLPVDKLAEGGSAMSMQKRWNKIFLRIINSAKPIINDQRPPTRHPSTPMNIPEQPKTEDIKVVGLGYDKLGEITVVQDLPLQTIIAGIFGEMSQENI